jgi:polysaccharide biosynthesis protein PslF
VRLLVISGAYPPHRSGEATNAFYLCQNLAERGLDVHVLTSQESVAHPHPRITLYPVMRDWSWREMPKLARMVRRSRPDAILLFYIGWIYPHQFMVTFAPFLAKRLLPGVPFVTRFENPMGADIGHTRVATRGIRKVMALLAGQNVDYGYGTLLRDSDRVIVLSERHRSILSEAFADTSKKSVLIPPAANMRVSAAPRDLGRQRLGVGDDAFVLTYIGYLYEGKGLESLLRAFAMVRAQRPNVRLVIMGGAVDSRSRHPASYVDTLHALASSLGVADDVIWTGPYSGQSEETSILLGAADVCVLPFRQGVHLNNSSFASVAAHGLPVITTRGEFFEEQFVHGENVFLCPPESPSSLATAIETVMTNQQLRERLRVGIAELTQEWFSWDRLVDRTLATCGLGAASDRLAKRLGDDPR